ncbi:MAG: hypothetical protein K2O13_06925, partial [Lachnospiraceae bacterium]|nr:hypothetical protein [Lachnospiraceae bacterium]
RLLLSCNSGRLLKARHACPVADLMIRYIAAGMKRIPWQQFCAGYGEVRQTAGADCLWYG